jgi:hypothetical protein
MAIRTEKGEYQPAYFYIKVDSKEEGSNLILNNKNVFIHEYIHFLQDISLPYLIRQSEIFYRKFRYAIITIKNNGFLRPFDRWDDDTKKTNLQRDYTLGEGTIIDKEISIININAEYVNNESHRIFKYNLLLNGNIKYHVGALDFYEYIASKLEFKFFNKTNTIFPYSTVDLLFEYYKFEYIPTECRLCIAEYCLYNDNPMNMFYNIIVPLINEHHDCFSDFEKCKEFLASTGWKSNGHPDEDMFKKINRRLLNMKEVIGIHFDNIYSKSIFQWLDSVIEYSDVNISKRFLFCNLYVLQKEQFEWCISKIIYDIGIPLIFNAEYKCSTLLPKGKYKYEEFFNLYLMNKFMEFIDNQSIICPVFTVCNNFKDAPKNDYCYYDLKQKASEGKKCLFCDFIKMFGLDTIKWL